MLTQIFLSSCFFQLIFCQALRYDTFDQFKSDLSPKGTYFPSISPSNVLRLNPGAQQLFTSEYPNEPPGRSLLMSLMATNPQRNGYNPFPGLFPYLQPPFGLASYPIANRYIPLSPFGVYPGTYLRPQTISEKNDGQLVIPGHILRDEAEVPNLQAVILTPEGIPVIKIITQSPPEECDENSEENTKNVKNDNSSDKDKLEVENTSKDNQGENETDKPSEKISPSSPDVPEGNTGVQVVPFNPFTSYFPNFAPTHWTQPGGLLPGLNYPVLEKSGLSGDFPSFANKPNYQPSKLTEKLPLFNFNEDSLSQVNLKNKLPATSQDADIVWNEEFFPQGALADKDNQDFPFVKGVPAFIDPFRSSQNPSAISPEHPFIPNNVKLTSLLRDREGNPILQSQENQVINDKKTNNTEENSENSSNDWQSIIKEGEDLVESLKDLKKYLGEASAFNTNLDEIRTGFINELSNSALFQRFPPGSIDRNSISTPGDFNPLRPGVNHMGQQELFFGPVGLSRPTMPFGSNGLFSFSEGSQLDPNILYDPGFNEYGLNKVGSLLDNKVGVTGEIGLLGHHRIPLENDDSKDDKTSGDNEGSRTTSITELLKKAHGSSSSEGTEIANDEDSFQLSFEDHLTDEKGSHTELITLGHKNGKDDHTIQPLGNGDKEEHILSHDQEEKPTLITTTVNVPASVSEVKNETKDKSNHKSTTASGVAKISDLTSSKSSGGELHSNAEDEEEKNAQDKKKVNEDGKKQETLVPLKANESVNETNEEELSEISSSESELEYDSDQHNTTTDSATQTTDSPGEELKQAINEFFGIIPTVFEGLVSIPFAIQEVMNTFNQKEFGGSETKIPTALSSDIFSANINEEQLENAPVIEPALVYKNDIIPSAEFKFHFTVKDGNSEGFQVKLDKEYINNEENATTNDEQSNERPKVKAVIVESFPKEDFFDVEQELESTTTYIDFSDITSESNGDEPITVETIQE